MSFVFQMDVDQKQNQHHQYQHHQQARSPSTPAQDRQPRFLVSYAPKPAQPTTTSPVYRAKAHIVSSVANPANDAIHKWLAAHQNYLPHDQPSSSFDTDSEDEEDEDEEEEEFESESEDEGMMMMMEQAGHSSSSDEDEDDSQLIFVRPRRHNSNNNIHTTSTSLHSTSSPLSRPTKATTPISVVPPTTTTRRTSPVDAPRQRFLPPIVIRTRAGRTGPAPVVTTTESALPSSSSSPFHHQPAAASPAMTNLLTAARPALPVVSLSAASAFIDLSMPNSHSNERSHWSDDEDLDEDNKEEEGEESDEDEDEVEEVEDEAQWAMEEEEVPALDVDEEGAPASTSTRSLPIPILASSPLLHAQQHQRPLKAQGPHISHLRRNRFIRGQRYHLGGDNSHSDEEYSDDGMDNSYRPQFEDEDMWDTSYQSPPTRKSTRQTYNIVHQDGQSFYGPWMNEYFTGVSVRD